MSLGWSVLFLIIPILVFAMIITEAVATYTNTLDLHAENDDGLHMLNHFYGSLGRSMLTLFWSISGGLSWSLAMLTLRDNGFVMSSNAYVAYIASIVFAVLNIVTGVF